MPTMMVSAEGASVRRRGSGKPRLVVRGQRRKTTAELLHKLQTLINQDDAENRRSAIHNYNAYFVLGPASGRVRTALGHVMKALQDAMNAKA